jgi:hypothetical protein
MFKSKTRKKISKEIRQEREQLNASEIRLQHLFYYVTK